MVDFRPSFGPNHQFHPNNQTMLTPQQIQLQAELRALNEALRKEIQHLKVVTGQNLTNGVPMVEFRPSFGPNHQFHPNNQPTLTPQQIQQLQVQSRNQLHHQHPFQQQQLQQFQHRNHG
ncbi:basic-leucine zipper domain-containing protein [Artemisia annua]|uniref:Basic-leucine zipper domain-containing protein n=1 Tax=Artemisia annua TaxID=35608 RepID=A0A2U1L326_ARTAN|nr:basic-leucine zipper domain-containing protein [Artemisia annua]